jgi:hypothetical protein
MSGFFGWNNYLPEKTANGSYVRRAFLPSPTSTHNNRPRARSKVTIAVDWGFRATHVKDTVSSLCAPGTGFLTE